MKEIKGKGGFYREIEPVNFDRFLESIKVDPINSAIEQGLIFAAGVITVCVVLNLFFCAVQFKKTPSGQLIVVKRDRSKFDELGREDREDEDDLGEAAERFDEEQLDIGILQRVREFEMTN